MAINIEPNEDGDDHLSINVKAFNQHAVYTESNKPRMHVISGSSVTEILVDIQTLLNRIEPIYVNGEVGVTIELVSNFIGVVLKDMDKFKKLIIKEDKQLL
jgi:hypothetical protein